MASGRAKKDKSLVSLKKESQKLYKDVTDLEDALILHQRYQNEEENSVRGLIRKEVGGSRWQHGGVGKLKTYKSTRDLEDPYGLENKNHGDLPRKNKQKRQGGTQLDQNMNVKEKNHQDADFKVSGKEALSAQRNNDGFCNETENENGRQRLPERKENGGKRDDRRQQKVASTNEKITDMVFYDRNLGIYDEDSVALLKTKVLEKASTHVIKRRKMTAKPGEHGKQSETEETNESVLNKMLTYKIDSKNDENLNVGQRDSKKTEKRKEVTDSDTNMIDKGKQSKLLSSKNNRKDIKQTNRIPLEVDQEWSPGLQNSTDKDIKKLDANQHKNGGEKVSGWTAEKQTLDQNSLAIGQISNGATGAYDAVKSVNGVKASPASDLKYKPSCDPDVHLWLRRLGLLEEDKYVNMFAENEIDMGILVELDEVQLNKMGVVAFGAMKKLLGGIEELKYKNRAEKSKGTASLKSEVASGKNPKRTDTEVKNVKKESDTTTKKDNGAFSEPQGIAKKESGASSEVLVGNDLDSKSKVRKKEEINSATFVKRSNVLQTKTYIKPDCDKVQTENNQQKSGPASVVKKRDSSASRPSSAKGVTSGLIRPQSAKSRVRDKQQGKTAPRSKSASGVQKKAPLGGSVTDGKNENRSKVKEEDESKTAKINKKAKMNRDEMASRHLEREKKKREDNADKADIDTGTPNKEDNRESNSEECLSELVGIKISANVQMDQGIQTAEPKIVEPVLKPPIHAEKRVKRSLYRSNVPKQMNRQSMALPTNSVEIQTDLTGKQPAISSYKPSTSRSLSRYSYSSRKNTVRDIETQIEVLQKKALSGEEVTMDLVKDLQKRLEQIENQIHDPEPSGVSLGMSGQLGKKEVKEEREDWRSGLVQQSEESDDEEVKGHREAEERIGVGKSTFDFSKTSVVSASMSKRELLDEIKKEKRQHRMQIKHLHSELSRIRNADPVKTVEIDRSDIDFDTDLIGEGTFSKVYHGLYQGSDVAIKQLRVPLSSQDKNYFAAEVSLLRDLRHPRVVLLMGVCTSEKLPIMVLEYMSNGSLYSLLHDQSRGPLDHAEYYRYAHDIALGMNFLHQHKPSVLHLDLKSMNVLICSLERAKIADFGFSKFRHDASMKANQSSKVKPVQGSPAWMAPEMLESGEITNKADVYSFGIILWEMLTRQQPYEGCSVFQVLERVRRNKRPELPNTCPEQLANFVQICWDPLPGRRPSFRDVLHKLENMAFPPEWQALLKEAGVPPAALEDVHSTRTIISLVSSRLDMENVKTVMEDIRMSKDSHVTPEKTESEKDCPAVKQEVNVNASEKSHRDQIELKIPLEDLDAEMNVEEPELAISTRSDNGSRDKAKVSDTSTVDEPKSSRKSTSDAKNPGLSTRLSLDTNKLRSQREKLRSSLDPEQAESSIVTNRDRGLGELEGNVSSRGHVNSQREEETDVRVSCNEKQTDGNIIGVREKTPRRNDGVKSKKKDDDLSRSQSLHGKLELHLQQKLGDIGVQSSETAKSKSRNMTPRLRSSRGKLQRDELEGKTNRSVTQGSESSVEQICEKRTPRVLNSECGVVSPGRSSVMQRADDGQEPGKFTKKSEENNLNDSLEIPEEIDVNELIDSDSLDGDPVRDSLDGKPENMPFKVNTESQPFKFVNQDTMIQREINGVSDRQNTARKEQTKVRNKPGSIITELNNKFQTGEDECTDLSSNGDQSASQSLFRTPRKSMEAWVDENDTSRDSVNNQDSTDRKRKISPSVPVIPPPILIPDNPPPPPPPVISINAPPAPPLPSSDSGFLVVKPGDLSKKNLRRVETTAKSPKGGKSRLAVNSDVNPSFLVQSMELREKKQMLQSTSQPHPNQLQDLSNVSKGTFLSIAEILRQAVSTRRLALGEDNFSPSQSVTSSWSFMDD